MSWRDDDEDQCATNSDCKAKGTVKTVCKEQAGQRKCVEPGLCQSRCSKDEICDQDDRCRAQPECKTDSDCGKAGQWICRKFSVYGTKTCVLDPNRELSEDPVVATESKVVKCGSNEDCAGEIDKTICKEVGNADKICVSPERCLGLCNRKEFCDEHHHCKVAVVCTSDDNCKEEEVCLSISPEGPSTCVRKPGVSPPALDECGSSLDCAQKAPKTLCKETGGRKKCVPEGAPLLLVASCRLNASS